MIIIYKIVNLSNYFYVTRIIALLHISKKIEQIN